MSIAPNNKSPIVNPTVAVALSAALQAAHKETVEAKQEAAPSVESSTLNFTDTTTAAPQVEEESPFAGILDSADDAEGQDDFGTLEIHSPKCLTCKALIPSEKKARKDCHYTSGNEHCPAQSARIILRVPVEKIAMQFRAAKAANDLARLGKLYAHLATFEDWYQERVTEYLKDKDLM